MTPRVRPESKHFTLQCKKLLDPASGKALENGFIEVNSGRILHTGTVGEDFSPRGELLDYREKTVIPGLVETHGHLYGAGPLDRHHTNDLLAPLYLAAGVTSARCPGSMEPETDLALQERIHSGRINGPRLFLSGEYLDLETTLIKWFHPVRTAEEARLKIDYWIGRGATSVKIYAAMKGEILKAAIDHGHAQGVKVIAHVGAVSFREAIELGIDELFHGVICCPETWPPDMDAVDYRRIFEYVPGLDLAQSEVPAMLRLASEARVVITPTAAVIQPYDPESRTQQDQQKFFSPEAWKKLTERDHGLGFSNQAQMYEKQLEFIRMAYEAGCILTTGTDITNYLKLPGFSLWDEMEIFSQAGIPNMEILKAATHNGAYALGRSDLLGALQPGKLADLVVLDGDPLEDIRCVREVHRVIKAGVVYDPQELYEPLLGKIK